MFRPVPRSPCHPRSVTCRCPSRAQPGACHTGGTRQVSVRPTESASDRTRSQRYAKKRGFSWAPGTAQARPRPRLIWRVCRRCPRRSGGTHEHDGHGPGAFPSTRRHGLVRGTSPGLGRPPGFPSQAVKSHRSPSELCASGSKRRSSVEQRLPVAEASREQPSTAQGHGRGRGSRGPPRAVPGSRHGRTVPDARGLSRREGSRPEQ